MTTSEDTPTGRLGSGPDLSRRMERIETRQDDQARQIGDLTNAVGRIEVNLDHQGQLYERDFKALNESTGRIGQTLDRFITRIEGMIDGTVETTQSRQGQQLIADYMAWRKETDKRLTIVEDVPTLTARVDSLEAAAFRRQGGLAALGAGKATLLMLAAIASPVLAIVALLVSHP